MVSALRARVAEAFADLVPADEDRDRGGNSFEILLRDDGPLVQTAVDVLERYTKDKQDYEREWAARVKRAAHQRPAQSAQGPQLGKPVNATADRSVAGDPAAGAGTPSAVTYFLLAEDGRSAVLHGINYTLTSQQAQVVELLFNARNAGTPELSHEHLLERIGSKARTLRDVFKNSDAWATLVVKGSKRGLYRLNI